MNAETPSANRPNAATILDIRHLSQAQLANLGLSQLAYIKPMMVNGEPAFAIHGADGLPMAVASDLQVAVAAVHQHEMVAAMVH